MPKIRYDGKDHDSITSYIEKRSGDEEWRRIERKACGYYGVRTPSGARMYAHTRNIEIDYIDVSSAEPVGVGLDAGRDLVMMAAYRVHPRAKNRWIWGLGPTILTVPLKGQRDPDRAAVMHALWDLDQGETSCALALVQKWSDEFPRDSGWAFDLRFEIGRFISGHPGVTRREVWEAISFKGQPRLLRKHVYEALHDMAQDGRLRTEPEPYPLLGWVDAKTVNAARFYTTATTPDRPNPFLLASAGLTFKAGEQS